MRKKSETNTTIGWRSGPGITLGAIAAVGLFSACGSSESPRAPTGSVESSLHGVIGAQGGELVGAMGSQFAGIHLVIPAGALDADTDVQIRPADEGTPLPSTAVRCGPTFTIEPAGLKLGAAATLTLPVDASIVADNHRFDDEVKVWALDGAMWGQRAQVDGQEGSVTVELDQLTTVAAGVNPPQEKDIVHFTLSPNPKFLRCLAKSPDDPAHLPEVDVIVVRGAQNDGLFLRGTGLKPGLRFDLFTVEHSNLVASGTVDPNFKNFGLAWYQTDLEANGRGTARVAIRTILLDQIFGFDPAANLPPTGTFHVGFWFNNPADAAPCGFDPSKPTPFNGEHEAGPLAMISVPDANTQLGPLCTKPDTSVSPARCSP